ncbi:MAG: histidine kinase N-terminal 7TM domain-containing protein [Algoriphagus sp.]|nr:histidine kinase N-terminal 7TM domain-containing protein [Algoriphagus sp.]
MEFSLNPFSITLLVSGLLVGLLSIFIAFKLEDSTRWIALTMLSFTIWGFFYGLELASTTVEKMLFWGKFEYLGISFAPAFWLIFSFKYTGLQYWRRLWMLLLVFSVPFLTYIMVLTNDWHHLHYASTSLNNTGPFPILAITVGPWYIVHMVYSYLAFSLAVFILWKRFRFSDPLFKTQTKLIMAAGAIPLIFNVFYQTGLIRPFEGIDLTPYAFLFTYLILAIAILKFNLFSIKPVARDKILEVITRGVLVFDARHKLIDFNPAVKNFFIPLELIKVGKNATEIFSTKEEILELLKEGERNIIESSFQSSKRTEIVRIESIPILERDTIFSGMVLLFENITSQVQVNEQLKIQTQELQQLNNLKDKFFSIISHDLKGPIFGVKELIHLTESGLVSKDEFFDMLPEVSKNMEHVSILLENLLAWTSSQLRGEHIQLQQFDVSKALQHQKNLLDRIAKEKNLTIKLGQTTEVLVEADKNMVDLVLRNLINNAIKFSEPNGEIILTAAYDKALVKICIEDQGIGISSENLSKINAGISFTTRGQNNESGTGLGMILVKEYVSKNSGSMEITSSEGKGTKFCIFLPAAKINKRGEILV